MVTPTHKPALTTLLLLALALICFAPRASASPFPEPSGRPDGFVPGQVIVKFRGGTPAAKRAAVVRDRNARVLQSSPLPGVRLLGLPVGASVVATAAALERDPAVAWAEPNARRQGGAVPSDALFGQQWALHNTGQAVNGDPPGTAGADIRAPEAWDRTTGSPNVKVAVIDSGVNLNSPDLAPNIWHNPGETGGGRESNGIDDDGNGYVDDWRGWDWVQNDNEPLDNFGHGTHVAGIIGARGNNGIGTTGVAWNTTIIPLRVADNLDQSSCFGMASAVAYAAAAGARVINASIWGHTPCQAEEDAIAAASDSLFVTIAGNDDGVNNDAAPSYPCNFPEPNIVCVAATDQRDQLAGFSNYGPNSVDLAAPGVSIRSTMPKWGPTQILLSDDFSNPLGSRWSTGGSPNSWGRQTDIFHSPSFSLADSPYSYYSNNANNYVELNQGNLDLRNETDCAATVWVKTTLGSGDALYAETASDKVDWAFVSAWSGTSSGFEQSYVDLGRVEGDSSGALAFAFGADGSGTADGVYLDDFAAKCVPTLTHYTGADDEYGFDYGTSMAAPHVAGVAALVLSLDPTMSTAALKARILGSVDPLPSLAGKTVTGGRLDAARAVGVPDRSPLAGGATPAGRGAGSAKKLSSALARDLRTVARALRRKALLRNGGLTVRVRALAAGRFTLKLNPGVATASSSSRHAGRLPLKLRLTPQGKRLLRRPGRLKVALTLRFAPSSGAAVSRSMKTTIRS
jgi:subtilisin family serine protease